MNARRPVQIATVPASDSHSYGIFALCDDGTIWEIFFNFTVKPPRWDPWEQVPEIPLNPRSDST